MYRIVVLLSLLLTNMAVFSFSDRFDEMKTPWTKPLNRMTLKEYIGAVNYFAVSHPGIVDLEVRGRTPKGLPVYLLKFTDKSVTSDNKNIVLLTTFHSGAERTGTCGVMGFAEWLLSGDILARETLKKNLILIMPNCCPEATFMRESFQNSRRAEIYTMRHGKDINMDTLAPKFPEDAPEVVAYQSVIDEFSPDVHVDVHGTGLHFNGWTQPPLIDRAGSNSSACSWDHEMVRYMIEAANRCGFGMIEMGDAQRLVWGGSMAPWQKSYCEMGQPYYTTAMYGYFKKHVLSLFLESTWRCTVVEPIKGLMIYLNQNEPAVDRIKTNLAFHIESYGRTMAERRLSRGKLWPKQKYFLVGCSYPETTNYRLAVAAYGPEGLQALTGSIGDSGRWGQVLFTDFCKYLEKQSYVDLPSIKRFIKYAPPRVKKIMYEKGDFDLKKDTVPALDSGMTLVIPLPFIKNDILHIARNGRPIKESAVNGYQLKVKRGFLEVRVNIPKAITMKEPLQIITCAWNPLEDRDSDFGYRPEGKAKQWIQSELDRSPVKEEVKKCEEILQNYRKNPEKYYEK